MLLGEGGGGDPGGEGRRALLGDVLRGDEHLAVLLELVQRRIPDEAAVEVAAVVAGDDVGLRDGEDLHVLLGEADALDEGEQLIMVGRDRRGGELLALEIGERIDPRAVAHDERLVDAGDRGEIERLDVQAARGRRGERARADIADLHVARRDGGEDFRAGIEAAEIDLDPGRLVEIAVGDRDRGGERVGLVADDHFVGGLGRDGAQPREGGGRACGEDAFNEIHDSKILLAIGDRGRKRRPSPPPPNALRSSLRDRRADEHS